jgi:hypothetical protein
MESRIERAVDDIRLELETAKSPIIAFSGGKDSMLLLYLVRRVSESVPVLIFQDFWPKDHKKWVGSVIEDQNLVAFFYRPSVLKYIDGSILTYYPFGASSIPVISDVIHTDDCGLDKGKRVLNRVPLARFLWDKVLTGSRKTDSHPLVPNLDFSGTNVVTPLWDWTDSQVWETTTHLNIPTSKTSSDAHLCMNCLEPEGRTVFCPKLNRNVESIGT